MRGASLAGLTFLLGSEPLTPARRQTIEASGARAAALYGSSEAPWIGGQCRHATSPDDVHVLLDGYAVVPGDATSMPAGAADRTLLFTSLRRALPKVLLNADIGDRAVIDRAPTASALTADWDATCGFDRFAVPTRSLNSASRLRCPDVFRVLEEIFPARFGGVAGDYQLVETRWPMDSLSTRWSSTRGSTASTAMPSSRRSSPRWARWKITIGSWRPRGRERSRPRQTNAAADRPVGQSAAVLSSDAVGHVSRVPMPIVLNKETAWTG